MSKSLKQQNNLKIWLIVAINAVLFWACVKSEAIRSVDLSDIAKSAVSLVPAGLAGIVATVLNSLVSADFKARIVFLRWHNALPGHRAFSQLAETDPRVNAAKLKSLFKGKYPNGESEENAAWYKLYKTVENAPSVNDAHRTFLLLRDYTTLSLFFLLIFGPLGLLLITDLQVALLNAGLLFAQLLLVNISARNAGTRMVTNVLALKTA